MQSKPNLEPLTFGFDIGIASVGWAVLSPTRIVDLGVRCFDKAETAKEGESLNLARRTARLMRRRLRRRAWRLTKLSRLLKRHGLIPDAEFFKQQVTVGQNLWQLRVDALDRLLTPEEWARVIYHLCKHRGFHWISRAEEKQAEDDTKSEGGRVKQGLAATKKLMHEKNYRSAAEMVLAEFPEAQRNKRGDYGKALSRIALGEELTLLFQKQRNFGNQHASVELELAILGTGNRKSGLFWEQKPPLAGVDLLKMLGKCTFEKTEYRAPKASFTAERHVWLTRLNNTRIVVDGITRSLNEAERRVALPLPYQQSGDLSYKQLGAALTKAGLLEKDSFKFTGLAYPNKQQVAEGKAKDPEAATLTKLPAWQALRKLLKEAGLETEWQGMAGAAQSGQPEQLDEIARVLSVFKDDDEVATELGKLMLPGGEKMIDALLNIHFEKFHALSLKALRQIVPHMESGLRYDEACEQAGYHHSQLFKVGEGEYKYLPPFYSGRDKDGRMMFDENMDIPRNPVVLRSLNQARKVMNALIRKHGSPDSVRIEMARDLSRPMDERSKIKKLQDEFRERNDKDRANFAAEFNISPRSREFERYQLYREQQGKCAYSLEALDIHRVLHETGYAEVDHALPYSRSFDDSKNNKVIALSRENRNKGNQTPYEYLDGARNSDRWRHYVAWVNKIYRQAKRSRLLRKDFGDKEAHEFRERNLNDTRYICRFFKNYVERYLRLADDSENKRCVVVSGQLTAFLRARWSLIKVRSDSDRHHALDAAVVAACSHGMVKRLSDYSRRKELEKVREGFIDMETGEIVNAAIHAQLKAHFPDPWPHFRHELNARLHTDNLVQLREDLQRLGSYSDDALEELKPLFVSRAPQRRNGGAAHKETIYGKPRASHRLLVIDKKTKEPRRATEKESETLAVERIGVTEKDQKGNYKFTTSRLDDIVDGERNGWMIHSLRLWLAERDDRDKRVKEIETTLGRGKDKREPNTDESTKLEHLRALPRKPCRGDAEDGPFTGPVIRTVKLNAGKTTGVQVRNGIATNDSMLRVDIFTKADKFYLVPVYVHHSVAKELPNRAVVSKKDENQWTVMDQNYLFRFSLCPNDLFQLRIEEEIVIGYFSGININDGGLKYFPHDQRNVDSLKKRGVSSAKAFTKLHVDVLGNIYPAPKEERRGLA